VKVALDRELRVFVPYTSRIQESDRKIHCAVPMKVGVSLVNCTTNIEPDVIATRGFHFGNKHSSRGSVDCGPDVRISFNADSHAKSANDDSTAV
jgi:hypothetical protein